MAYVFVAIGGNFFPRPTVVAIVMNDLSVEEIDSRLSVLYAPDELAAHEYQRTFQRRTLLEPEKKLMLAILEDAIFCLQRYLHAKGRKQRRLHEDTVTWIFDYSDYSVFSVENICVTCGLDPDYLRMGLLKWREETKPIKESPRGKPLGAPKAQQDTGHEGSQTAKLTMAKRSQRMHPN